MLTLKPFILCFAAGVVVACSQTPELGKPLGGAADIAGGESPMDANLRPVVHETPASGAAGTAAHAGHEHGEVIHYTCPMHPQIDVTSPGKCPICGMALVVKTSTTKGAP